MNPSILFVNVLVKRSTRYFWVMTQAKVLVPAKLQSMTAGATGAACMVWQQRQLYWGRMWRSTQNLAGCTCSCSVMLPETCAQGALAAGALQAARLVAHVHAWQVCRQRRSACTFAWGQ
jgi:hypothetical protein